MEGGKGIAARFDALINNAALYGALHGGRFDAIDEAEWDAAMAVNVKGIWNCCKAAVPAMKQAGGGSIVNIASLAATYGMPYGLHYTTSKAAVIGLTRGLARDLGRDRIRVNALAPSAVITEGTREFFGARMERALETIKSSQTIQRNLMPEDLAGTVLWLISDASGFVTGQTVAADGGRALSQACDVASEAQTRAVADAAHDAFGRLDILVSGAAPHDPSGTVIETSLADWQRVLDINLTGAFLLSR